MAERSFKNIGSTVAQIRAANPVFQETPIGIKTPMSFSAKGNPYQMNLNIADQIQDNLKNLLLTQWGERIGLYDYGANLRSVISEFTSINDIETPIMQSIVRAVEKYMPFVSLDTFDMQFLEPKQDGFARYQIIVNYSVPKLNEKNQKVKIILEVMG
jgi:phage baseplate assembly protein W